jgi:hypothetical protein
MMKYDDTPTIAPSAQSTPHPREAHVGPREQVEDQHQPQSREPGADQGDRAGALAVAKPQPQDDGGRGRVLDQQRRTDVHVADRREVAELGAGDGEQAVARDQGCVAA